jgi:hypothetical protein
VGAVARDSLGKFIAASTVYLPSVASAAAAEAMAMRDGLSLATRLGCNNVLMEFDSTETVDACLGDEPWWGESSAIFVDYVDLAALVGNVSFKHCPREANEAAHELARVCFASISFCNWVDEPPSFLLEKLINDVIELLSEQQVSDALFSLPGYLKGTGRFLMRRLASLIYSSLISKKLVSGQKS